MPAWTGDYETVSLFSLKADFHNFVPLVREFDYRNIDARIRVLTWDCALCDSANGRNLNKLEDWAIAHPENWGCATATIRAEMIKKKKNTDGSEGRHRMSDGVPNGNRTPQDTKLEVATVTLWHRICSSEVELKAGELLNVTMEISRLQNNQVKLWILLASVNRVDHQNWEWKGTEQNYVKDFQFGKKKVHV